jgi:hypothetical protein
MSDRRKPIHHAHLVDVVDFVSAKKLSMAKCRSALSSFDCAAGATIVKIKSITLNLTSLP